MQRSPKSVAALAATVLVGLSSAIAIVTIVARNAEVVKGKNQQLAQTNQELDNSIVQLGKANKYLQESNTAEQKAKEEALASKEESDAVLSFFRDKLLAAARPEEIGGGLGIHVTLRAALDAAELLIPESFEDRPLVEASIRYSLGITYADLGEGKLAISQLERARALRESELGPEHLDTLYLIGHLARAYYAAGQEAKAMALLKQILKPMKAKVGPAHPNILMLKSTLAQYYGTVGRWDEAIEIQEENVKLSKAKFGANHIITISAMNSLASNYSSTHRLNEALALFEEVDKRKANLGPENPYTLQLMRSLAEFYSFIGRLDEAFVLHEESIRLNKAKFGLHHPQTLRSMSSLATAYKIAGRLDEAIALSEETFKLYKANLGPKHRFTLSEMYQLAGAYTDAGRLDEALPLYEEKIRLSEAKFGPEHRDALISRGGLAVMYWKFKKLDQSIPLFEACLESNVAKLGVDHPATLIAHANLGVNYCDAGRLEQGIRHLEIAQKQAHKYSHLLWIASKLVDAYIKSKMTDKATLLVSESVANARHLLPPESRQLARVLVDDARGLLQLESWAVAESCLREGLEICEEKSLDDWETSRTKSLLGGALVGQARELLQTDNEAAHKKLLAEAELLLVDGLKGMKAHESKILPVKEIRITEALQRLVDLYSTWDKPEEAAKWQAILDTAKAATEKKVEE